MSTLRRTINIVLCVFSIMASQNVAGQELNCTVEVNAQKIQNANKEIFNTLKEAISEYLNTTKWTDAQFGANEKIECTLYLTLSSYEEATGKMTGDIQIQ